MVARQRRKIRQVSPHTLRNILVYTFPNVYVVEWLLPDVPLFTYHLIDLSFAPGARAEGLVNQVEWRGDEAIS